MYGVGGDPEARFPRKLSHTGAGAGVQERWGGGRFDYLDPALRSALTEWPHFDEVDELLMSRVKRRVEIDFVRNRMDQMSAPFADRSQHGVEVLEYFALGGHAFACVVAEQMPREPGVVQFVRFFYVEALDAEAAAAFAHEQATAAQAVTEQRQREEAIRMQAEAEAARLAQIDQEEKEREERLLAESMARAQMEKLRLERETALLLQSPCLPLTAHPSRSRRSSCAARLERDQTAGAIGGGGTLRQRYEGNKTLLRQRGHQSVGTCPGKRLRATDGAANHATTHLLLVPLQARQVVVA
jgi:hypothetical protein|eukprot:SAG25_NODE_1699_length_2520_cov_3.208591_2_plen_299_part_00